MNGWRRVVYAAWMFALVVGLLAGNCARAQSSPARAATSETREPDFRNVFWQPDQLVQGSPILFNVDLGRAATRVTGTWIGKRLTFFPSSKPHVWYALAGVDLNVEPGSYALHIAAALRNGHVARTIKHIDVGAANFGTGSVDVAEDYVEPNADEKKQIARDQVLKKQAFEHFIPRPLWSGNFLKPVDGPSTPSFGETRLMNEEKTSRHLGTDFPVKEGTPVVVSNAGVVVLAAPLYYEGNCVIVDHGERFFTIYMHLSKIDVIKGERLPKGAKVGLSGATGRVTGPHLHMGVRWDGAYVDPVQLLSLTLPDRADAHAMRRR